MKGEWEQTQDWAAGLSNFELEELADLPVYHSTEFAPDDPHKGRRCGICGTPIPRGLRGVHSTWCNRKRAARVELEIRQRRARQSGLNRE
jgi:hypothetical protein